MFRRTAELGEDLGDARAYYLAVSPIISIMHLSSLRRDNYSLLHISVLGKRSQALKLILRHFKAHKMLCDHSRRHCSTRRKQSLTRRPPLFFTTAFSRSRTRSSQRYSISPISTGIPQTRRSRSRMFADASGPSQSPRPRSGITSTLIVVRARSVCS